MVNILEEKPDGCIKLLLCNMLGAASVMIAWAALPRGDTGRGQDTRPPLDFRPVLANRDGSAPDHRLIRGNLGLRRTAAVDCRLSYLLRGALISFLDVPAGLIGNEFSIRHGLRNMPPSSSSYRRLRAVCSALPQCGTLGPSR